MLTGLDLVAVEDMPVVDKLISEVLFAELCRHLAATHGAPDVCVIERVSAMPRQGVSSTFKFGTAYGIQRAVPAALGWPVEHVTPQHWKRAMRLSADKDESRRRAIELWPTVADRFARKRDDGRAEAALIARWRAEQLLPDAHGITHHHPGDHP